MIERLKILIKSRCPMLQVVTTEEVRAADFLYLLGKELGKKVYSWAPGNSLKPYVPFRINSPYPPDERLPFPPDPIDIATCFNYIKEFARRNPGTHTFYIIFWPHSFPEDPFTVWTVKETYEALRLSYHTLFVISTFEVPVSLRNNITVFPFPKPEIKEIESFMEGLNVDFVPPKEAARLLAGLTMDEVETVLAIIKCMKETDWRRVIREEKARIIGNIPGLELVEPEPIENVGGLTKIKKFAEMVKLSLTPEAQEFGISLPRSVLFAGPPGTGKSLSVKALSSFLGLMAIRLNVGALFGPLLGQTEASTREALTRVQAAAPAILWIDEIEKLFREGREIDGGTSSRVFGELLTWMQEARGVLVAATVNQIELLRPELLERFQYRFFIPLPSFKARKEIFEIHLRKRKHQLPPEQVEWLASITEGYSGRTIEAAVESGLLLAYASGIEIVKAIEERIRALPPLSATVDLNAYTRYESSFELAEEER